MTPLAADLAAVDPAAVRWDKLVAACTPEQQFMYRDNACWRAMFMLGYTAGQLDLLQKQHAALLTPLPVPTGRVGEVHAPTG
jgi:hypothetical protein